jgi:hypothetical protein
MLKTFTVGDLRRHLEVFADDWELQFGPSFTDGALTFYRTKARGEKLVQIEFNELFEIEHPDPA